MSISASSILRGSVVSLYAVQCSSRVTMLHSRMHNESPLGVWKECIETQECVSMTYDVTLTVSIYLNRITRTSSVMIVYR